MTRYVVASRRAGKFHEAEKLPAREAAERAISALSKAADVLGALNPPDASARQVAVLDADPGEVAARAEQFGPDVMVEREILHHPTSVVLPLDLAQGDQGDQSDALAGTGVEFGLTVQDDAGQAVANAAVVLGLRGPGRTNRLTGITGLDGHVSFEFSAFWSASAAIVEPAGGHWPMIVRGPRDAQVIVTPTLPDVGPFAWWHTVLGVDNPGAGTGMRVGVADTGMGPHGSLTHGTGIGSFIDGNHDTDPAATLDVDSHGTHVCGTIGARPSAPEDPVGIASGVDLWAARVFAGAESGANQGDIASAVDTLSRDFQTDLINLSLGSPDPSEIIRDAIQDAVERGTVCVCAAGNSAGPVEFPGGFDESIGIAALGLDGWGPPGSLAAMRLPTSSDRFGIEGLYLANFSCFGEQIDAAAPGVGIIASLPERFGLTEPLGALDGTSMASPAACAALAGALSVDPAYAALPRDTTRAIHARTMLRTMARHVGMAAAFEGAGVPQG